jgi:tetratricopeptide (TPR) repeat protein
MSYLILDTDKHSTHALHQQLSGVSNNPIVEVADLGVLKEYKERKRVPPEVIILDLEGDPERVNIFKNQLLEYKAGASALVTLSSDSSQGSILKPERHLRKPVYAKNLKIALVEAQRKSQEKRSDIVYFGDRQSAANPVLSELIREVGRSAQLWLQIIEVPELQDLMVDKRDLSRIGAFFIQPEKVDESALAAIKQIYRITSANRISLVCLSQAPEKIQKIRQLCDYFVSAQSDWRLFLDQLAQTRLMRLATATAIDEAKLLMTNGKYPAARKTLERLLKSAPLKIEALLQLGDCFFFENKKEEAKRAYRDVLKLNPCLPKPYARMLALSEDSFKEQIRAEAAQYCPDLAAFRKQPDLT